MITIGFMASHGGSGMHAILQAVDKGLQAKPLVLVCNNEHAKALTIAKQHQLQCYHLSTNTHPDPAQLDAAILSAFTEHGVDLILLSGYMKKIGGRTLHHYENRILNIHPALLPAFGGQGMYGDRVHQAVLQQGDKQSGATVHWVNENYDEGAILLQQHVDVSENETIDSLREKIKGIEGPLYVRTLTKIIRGDIQLP